MRMEYENTKVDNIINEWIHSERDRYILHRRFIDGRFIRELIDDVAEKYGYEMSYRQIQRIVTNGSTVIFSKYE